MELRVPEGINYECTGCGKCCSGWSVPLTQEDYERIAEVDWAALDDQLKDKELFRKLAAKEKANTPYSHAINPESNGQCPFLKDNLCLMHGQLGAAFKPAICQLFPYSFNETPEGVFVAVSFISRGAVLNAGRALNEQRNYLAQKYQDFKKLFGDQSPNWSALKLSSNLPMTWDEYIEIEKPLLLLMQDRSRSLEDRFIEGSVYLDDVLSRKLENTTVKIDSPPTRSVLEDSDKSLNRWDRILLGVLCSKYFNMQGRRAKGYGQLNLDFASFMAGAFSAAKYKGLAAQHNALILTDLDADIRHIIERFFYSRLFAKLYFGAGFGQLSLIAGFNHLAVTLALLKIKLTENARKRSSERINLDDAVKAIVELEKSLGELKISPYGAAILELLLCRQQRIGRILSLS